MGDLAPAAGSLKHAVCGRDKGLSAPCLSFPVGKSGSGEANGVTPERALKPGKETKGMARSASVLVGRRARRVKWMERGVCYGQRRVEPPLGGSAKISISDFAHSLLNLSRHTI